MHFSLQEALSGNLSEDSWGMVQNRHDNCDGAAEPEPPGQAQNSMQCYVRAQAVADKVSLLIVIGRISCLIRVSRLLDKVEVLD